MEVTQVMLDGYRPKTYELPPRRQVEDFTAGPVVVVKQADPEKLKKLRKFKKEVSLRHKRAGTKGAIYGIR